MSSEPVSAEYVTTTIDLLRHGEVQGGSCYRGQQDDPLTESGWQQLRETTNNTQNWQQIVTSPLKRCSLFAEELANKKSLPLIEIEEFKEVSFGLWEGKTADELLESDPEKIKKYWNDPVNATPPEGENLLTFQKRVLVVWEKLITEFQGQHVLLISHAGVMRIILCHILNIPISEMFKLDVALAKASRVQIAHTDSESWPRLIFHGSTF